MIIVYKAPSVLSDPQLQQKFQWNLRRETDRWAKKAKAPVCVQFATVTEPLGKPMEYLGRTQELLVRPDALQWIVDRDVQGKIALWYELTRAVDSALLLSMGVQPRGDLYHTTGLQMWLAYRAESVTGPLYPKAMLMDGLGMSAAANTYDKLVILSRYVARMAAASTQKWYVGLEGADTVNSVLTSTDSRQLSVLRTIIDKLREEPSRAYFDDLAQWIKVFEGPWNGMLE